MSVSMFLLKKCFFFLFIMMFTFYLLSTVLQINLCFVHTVCVYVKNYNY